MTQDTGDVVTQAPLKYLMIEQVAEMLGVSSPKIKEWVERDADPMPCFIPSPRIWRFNPLDVHEWCRRNGSANVA